MRESPNHSGSTSACVTEYLEIDLASECWRCRRCGHELGPARESYKHGCLVDDRDPREIHPPVVEGEYTFAPNPSWCRIVEFFCPGCATLLETEYLPPGHPVTRDIEIDVDRLLERAGEED